jgi:hypothetical protein
MDVRSRSRVVKINDSAPEVVRAIEWTSPQPAGRVEENPGRGQEKEPEGEALEQRHEKHGECC